MEEKELSYGFKLKQDILLPVTDNDTIVNFTRIKAGSRFARVVYDTKPKFGDPVPSDHLMYHKDPLYVCIDKHYPFAFYELLINKMDNYFEPITDENEWLDLNPEDK